MCFSGRRRKEETAYKTWVGQLILIVVSMNYSAISGNYPLSHHSFPLCEMGRVIEKLNLGTWSPSTVASNTCLWQIPSSAQPGSHILPAHRSQEA